MHNIYILHGCGARNLLVANTGPWGASPSVPEELKAATTGLSWQYNVYLQEVLDIFSGEPFNMNISTFDFFGIVTDVWTAPEAFGFTTVTETCVTYGVLKDAYCDNRDEYIWWDALHPTKKFHALLAEAALGQLPVLGQLPDPD